MMTAEEFFRVKLRVLYPFQAVVSLSQELITAEKGMRWAQEYSILKAKFYVVEALKKASEKAKIEYDHFDDMAAYINDASILNAYSLDNIK